MRYAKRRDQNHQIIAFALRKAGFVVIDFASAGHSIPDLLVMRPLRDGKPWISWVEVKSPGGKLDKGQKEFRGVFDPRGEWYLAVDPELTVMDLMRRYVAELKTH